jgi:hypothetical protein
VRANQGLLCEGQRDLQSGQLRVLRTLADLIKGR